MKRAACNPVEDAVRRFAARFGVDRARGPLVVAASGGADSTALLVAACALRDEKGWTVEVAHVEHGWRDTRREREHLGALCTDLGVVLHVLPAPTAPRETPAREARLAVLAELARSRRAQAVALAHTADDQAETLLLHLLRGGGLRAAAGMPPVRRPFVRPLLDVTHAELVAYLTDRGIPWVEDPTNADPVHLRNRVRHEVLAALEAARPGAALQLARAAGRVREDLDALEGWLRQRLARATRTRRPGFIAVDLALLDDLPRPLQRLALRLAVEDARGTRGGLYARHLDALAHLASDRRGSARIDLPGGWRARRTYGELVVEREGEPAARRTDSAVRRLTVPGPGCYPVRDDLLLVVDALPAERAPDPRRPDAAVALFDRDALTWPLYVRAPSRGDRMHPFGAPGRRLVSDVLGEARVPRWQRAAVPVIADPRGTVLWLAGIRRSDAAPVADGTRRVVRLALATRD